MKLLITRLLGSYEAVTTEMYAFNTTTNEVYAFTAVPDGLAGVDWAWIAGALAFLICLYCVFRLVGVFLPWIT